MKSATLGNLCKNWGGNIQTGPFGSQLHQYDYREIGTPVVMPQDIVEDRISDSKIARIDESKADQLSRHRLVDGDIVFPRRGDIGKRALIGPDHVGYLCGTGCMKISAPRKALNPKWLFYYLAQSQIVKWVENKAVGATMLNLNTSILGGVPVVYPDLVVQERIAEKLANYDDLIETNRLRIALLEESARLLYREWFVKLRFPGHELVEKVDGVPAGWQQMPISGLATSINRGITPKYDDTAKGLVINQKCIRDGRLSLEQARYQSKEVKADRLIHMGDVLINSTGTGTLGRVAQVRRDIPDCTVDTHVTIVRPRDMETICYVGVALLELEQVFSQMGIGATNQTELNRADIGAVQMLVPPMPMRIEFHNSVWPLFEQVENLSSANSLLAQARDALLPKLMSGQLTV